jgi:hypothetical protein
MKIDAPGIALALLVSVLPGQRLLAARSCGNEDFKGTYGVLANGSITVPGFPITGPFARAGQIIPDGQGNVIANSTASYNGNMFSEQLMGTYTVSADCTITFHLQPFDPIDLPATFGGILSADRREVTFLILDPPGQTIRAVLRKQGGDGQDERGCSVRDLSRPYALLMQGNVLTAPRGQLPGEFVRGGKFTPDGMGNFSAETNANYNGVVIQAENFSGTYTVAADCTMTVQYNYNNTAFTWFGSLIDHGTGTDLVVKSPAGMAIGGVLSQQ